MCGFVGFTNKISDNGTDKTLETPVGELLPYEYLISEK